MHLYEIQVVERCFIEQFNEYTALLAQIYPTVVVPRLGFWPTSQTGLVEPQGGSAPLTSPLAGTLEVGWKNRSAGFSSGRSWGGVEG